MHGKACDDDSGRWKQIARCVPVAATAGNDVPEIEGKYRALLENSDDATLIANADNVIRTCTLVIGSVASRRIPEFVPRWVPRRLRCTAAS